MQSRFSKNNFPNSPSSSSQKNCFCLVHQTIACLQSIQYLFGLELLRCDVWPVCQILDCTFVAKLVSISKDGIIKRIAWLFWCFGICLALPLAFCLLGTCLLGTFICFCTFWLLDTFICFCTFWLFGSWLFGALICFLFSFFSFPLAR